MDVGYAGKGTPNQPPQVAEVSRTDLDRLSGNLASSGSRIDDMLNGLDSRLDNFTSAPSSLAQTASGGAAPDYRSGTLGALEQCDARFRDRADRLDALLTRLFKIL